MANHVEVELVSGFVVEEGELRVLSSQLASAAPGCVPMVGDWVDMAGVKGRVIRRTWVKPLSAWSLARAALVVEVDA